MNFLKRVLNMAGWRVSGRTARVLAEIGALILASAFLWAALHPIPPDPCRPAPPLYISPCSEITEERQSDTRGPGEQRLFEHHGKTVYRQRDW